MPDPSTEAAWLEELPHDVCLARLREETVGRLGFMVDDHPMVLPVNYRLVETSAVTWIAIRTRPGNVIDQAPEKVAFEIDGIDPVRKQGWSVVVRGMLQRVDPDAADFRERFDTEPWLEERDAWWVIEPFAITGRALHPAAREWAFHTRSYL